MKNDKNIIKLSEMKIGDVAWYDGGLVELKDGGGPGGCKYDLWLANAVYEGDINDLPDLVLDVDDDIAEIDTCYDQ
jgi:hypothetical protein